MNSIIPNIQIIGYIIIIISIFITMFRRYISANASKGEPSAPRTGANEAHSVLPPVTLSDIKGRMKYKANNKKRTSIHIGQRKLFLNELQFMTNFNPDIVIYAGAAPSMHIWRLHELFPQTKFLLVDPNEVCIIKRKGITHYEDPIGVEYLEVGRDVRKYYTGPMNVNYKGNIVDKETVRGIAVENIVMREPVTIIENLFTNDLARKIHEYCASLNGKVAFWSDIRTNNDENTEPSELDIYWNSAQQLAWVDIIKPNATMLKFRCPYIEHMIDRPVGAECSEAFAYCKMLGIDFLEDYKNRRFNYISGDVYIQPWAGCSSSEGRLVFTEVKFKAWDSIDYENAFYYYNNVDRLAKYYNHKIDRKHCIDRCGDCALEALIWTQYAHTHSSANDYSANVYSLMVSLSDYLGINGRSLCSGAHGKLY